MLFRNHHKVNYTHIPEWQEVAKAGGMLPGNTKHGLFTFHSGCAFLRKAKKNRARTAWENAGNPILSIHQQTLAWRFINEGVSVLGLLKWFWVVFTLGIYHHATELIWFRCAMVG